MVSTTILGQFTTVGEHPAPSGALRRCRPGPGRSAPRTVREHPAPPGALRCDCERTTISTPALRQGAPSTIRCIETLDVPEVLVVRVQSGSTQHHQVHLRPCSRGAGRGPLPKWQGAEADRHRDGAACGRVVSAPGASFCPEVRTQGPRIRQRCSHTRAESSRCGRCCVA